MVINRDQKLFEKKIEICKTDFWKTKKSHIFVAFRGTFSTFALEGGQLTVSELLDAYNQKQNKISTFFLRKWAKMIVQNVENRFGPAEHFHSTWKAEFEK